MADIFCFMGIFILFLFTFLAVHRGIIIIKPHQEGLYIFLGRLRRILKPGINFVSPFMRDVIIVDMREQVVEIKGAEATTADSTRLSISVDIHYRIVDSMKAVFEVRNHKIAIEELFRALLKVVMADMRYEEITSNPSSISEKMRDTMGKSTEKWGIKIYRIDIKNIYLTGMDGSGEARLFTHLIGKKGVVIETIDPYHMNGVVELEGMRYNASAGERIEKGSSIVVEQPMIILAVRKEGEP